MIRPTVGSCKSHGSADNGHLDQGGLVQMNPIHLEHSTAAWYAACVQVQVHLTLAKCPAIGKWFQDVRMYITNCFAHQSSWNFEILWPWQKNLYQLRFSFFFLYFFQTATKLSNSRRAILVCVFVCSHCHYSFRSKNFLHMHTDIYDSTNYLPRHWPFTARINESTPPHEPLICYEWSWGQTAPHLPVSSLVTSQRWEKAVSNVGIQFYLVGIQFYLKILRFVDIPEFCDARL